MNKVVLLIGGNMGNRYDNLLKTINLIEIKVGNIIDKSEVYETEAWGFESEENFLNQVLIVNSIYSPEECLVRINEIESKLGRIRESKRWISRVMDIDILFYNDDIIKTDNLTIPHKHIAERKFTLIPLNNILSDYVHPELNTSINKLLDECEDKSWVKVFKTND